MTIHTNSWEEELEFGLRTSVVELMVAGRAMRAQRVQMVISDTATMSCVVLGERGLITARRLSKVMASMVNTLAGTVEREMNWLREQ